MKKLDNPKKVYSVRLDNNHAEFLSKLLKKRGSSLSEFVSTIVSASALSERLGLSKKK